MLLLSLSRKYRVEIAGEGETVVVSWWETNQTSDIPVARISTDAGETFDPMLRLATNGTISAMEEEGEGKEAWRQLNCLIECYEDPNSP